MTALFVSASAYWFLPLLHKLLNFTILRRDDYIPCAGSGIFYQANMDFKELRKISFCSWASQPMPPHPSRQECYYYTPSPWAHGYFRPLGSFDAALGPNGPWAASKLPRGRKYP